MTAVVAIILLEMEKLYGNLATAVVYFIAWHMDFVVLQHVHYEKILHNGLVKMAAMSLQTVL